MKKEILQRRYELNYFPKINKALRDRISSLIEVIESRGVEAGFSYLSTQTDSGELSKIITDLYQKVGLRFARMQWSELKEQERRAKMQAKGFGFNPEWVRFLKDYLQKFLVDKILFKVAETTRKLLTAVLQDSIEKGLGIAETVRELRKSELTATQAARIARTEITRASNAGTYAAAETFPFEQVKEWIAAHDKRTRGQEKTPHASHVLLDGTTIDYDDYFVDPVNGDEMLFPGDPGEPGRVVTAASTINCRCSVAIVAKRDSNGRLIPKVDKVKKEMKFKEIEDIKNEMKSHFEDIIRVVREEKPEPVDILNLKLSINNRMDEVERKYNESSLSVVKEVREIKENLQEDKNIEVLNKVDELTEAIKGVKVEPVVNVEKTDNTSVLVAVAETSGKIEEVGKAVGEVKKGIGEMKDEIVKELKELKKKKPVNYNIEFQRDDMGYLKSPIKVVSK